MREGIFCLFKKKKEEKIKTQNLDGSLELTVEQCCTESQINMQMKINMKSTRIVQHLAFIKLVHRVCAWLCTKDYMQLRQNLYKEWLPGKSPATAPYG